MKQVIFLVSGGGGTLRFLVKMQTLFSEFQVVAVIADRDCGALRFAQKQEIRNYRLSKIRLDFNRELAVLLESLRPDIVVTTVYQILDESITRQYAGRLLNLHYSLLPAYAGMIGMNTVKAGIEQGASFVGATVHWVEKEVDMGKILGQVAIPASGIKTVEEVGDTVFRAGCICLLNCLLHLQTKREYQGQSVESIGDRIVVFSPALQIDLSHINDQVWEEIRKETLGIT